MWVPGGNIILLISPFRMYKLIMPYSGKILSSYENMS